MARNAYQDSQQEREIAEEQNQNTNNTPTVTNSPVNSPNSLPQINVPNLATMAATADQIRAVLEGIFEANDANLNALQANIREKATVKVNNFRGTDTEDPIEWLDAFVRVFTVNRWTTDQRKCEVVRGFLRGTAAAWFDDNRITMNNN